MEFCQELSLSDSEGNVYGLPHGIPQICPECGRDLRARWLHDEHPNCQRCKAWYGEHFKVKTCQFCDHPTHGEENGDLCGITATSFDETLGVITNQGLCICKGASDIPIDSILDPIRKESFVGLE